MSFDSGDNVYDNYSQCKWLPDNDTDVSIIWPDNLSASDYR